MNKKVILVLAISFFYAPFGKAVDFLRDLREINVKIVKVNRQLLFNTIDSEQEENLKIELALLKEKRTALEPIYELSETIRDSELYTKEDKDSMLTILANASEFVYANADLYANDKAKLKNRLKIHNVGSQVTRCPWEMDCGGKCTNMIEEVHHMLNAQLQLNDIQSASKESPEEMLKDIRNRYGNDDHLNDWGVRTYMEEVISRGLHLRAQK